VHCVVTSPPYWSQRDYGIDNQIGLEKSPQEYTNIMVEIFREVWRVLRDDGSLWLNIGDTYNSSGVGKNPGGFQGERMRRNPDLDKSKIRQDTKKVYKGLKPKDLVGIPWRLALALQNNGWYLRRDIIWHKTNPMPESAKDRPTTAHEYIFLLTKKPHYYYDYIAVMEDRITKEEPLRDRSKESYNQSYHGGRFSGGKRKFDYGNGKRNRRSVWTISLQPYKGAHFATFPEKLVIPCIEAGTSEYGVCPKCAAPWKRIVETKGGTGKSWHNHEKDMVYGQRGDPMPKEHGTLTAGWGPTCNCGINETVPAIVFDPFIGSGTTILAANNLGRKGIGIDLSSDYLELAKDRCIIS
jgi:DNA modification methylase